MRALLIDGGGMGGGEIAVLLKGSQRHPHPIGVKIRDRP
jgi:uncharacterized protein YwbE